jgi:hypothetical protein
VTLVDEVDAVQDVVMRVQQLAEKQAAAARHRKAILALSAAIGVALAVWWRKRRRGQG